MKTRVFRDAEGRRRTRRKGKKGKGKKKGRKEKRKKKKGKKVTKKEKTKKGKRKIPVTISNKTPRAVFKGSHCEFFELAKISENGGCTNGFKFVIKQVSNILV